MLAFTIEDNNIACVLKLLLLVVDGNNQEHMKKRVLTPQYLLQLPSGDIVCDISYHQSVHFFGGFKKI